MPMWWWGPSMNCGGEGSCGSSVTDTTSPTTCSAKRRTRSQPPQAVAAAPPHRPGPGTAARRGQEPGRGSARRAVCPGRPAGPGGGLLPAGRRRRGGHVRHAEAIRLHEEALSIIHGLPAGDRTASSRSWSMAAPLNAMHGYSSPELQQTLERSIALAEALGRKDSTVNGLVALWRRGSSRGVPPMLTRLALRPWPWWHRRPS